MDRMDEIAQSLGDEAMRYRASRGVRSDDVAGRGRVEAADRGVGEVSAGQAGGAAGSACERIAATIESVFHLSRGLLHRLRDPFRSPRPDSDDRSTNSPGEI